MSEDLVTTASGDSLHKETADPEAALLGDRLLAAQNSLVELAAVIRGLQLADGVLALAGIELQGQLRTIEHLLDGLQHVAWCFPSERVVVGDALKRRRTCAQAEFGNEDIPF